MQKKEELFRQGNVAKWEISPEELNKADKNLLLKNREYAFSKIMTKVYSIFNIFIGNSSCIWTKTKLCLLFDAIDK
jgi:hypothetical protein